VQDATVSDTELGLLSPLLSACASWAGNWVSYNSESGNAKLCSWTLGFVVVVVVVVLQHHLNPVAHIAPSNMMIVFYQSVT